MRLETGQVISLSNNIRDELSKSLRSLMDIRGIANLSDCASCALISRSVNSMEWKSVLPRESSEKSKEKWISKVLDSPLIEVPIVMKGLAHQVLKRMSKNGEAIVLSLDQSHLCDGREILMVSLRFGARGILILWKVEDTKGAIGFDVQKKLFDQIKEMIPPDVEILLSADRFYGTKNLVELCKENGWSYRIRLKGNLFFQHAGVRITASDVGKMPESRVLGVCFNNSNISTNIGYLHEKNHPEPWIIAMNCEPSKHKILEYEMRWNIEAVFSDFKSRGFEITNTHIRKIDRLEKLILILTIALYWATSVGMSPETSATECTTKKRERSRCSFFKKGLRTVINLLLFGSFYHLLWSTL